jgi:acyl-CoA synthetase (AMP-forming)/AMP-acid ligase II
VNDGTYWTFANVDGSRPALLGHDRPTVTYDALSDAADRWMTRLREAAGDLAPLVALELVTTTDAIAAYLGALRAGLPLLIVEPGKLGSGSQLARTWRADLNMSVGPDGALCLSERPGWRAEVASLPRPHPDLRVLLSTSGSTGEPKLVRLSGCNMAANARSIAEYLSIDASDRAMTTLPLFYSYGLSVLNSYLSVGAALIVTDESVTEPAFWDTARAAGATSLAFVPHQFDLLRGLGFHGAEVPTLRYVTQAGGRLDRGAMEHFWGLGQASGWQLFVMYGQTEAAPRISFVPPEALPHAGDTIGRAIPGGRLWLVDEAGCDIHEPGRAGELVYEGPNVMMGYATSREDLAAEAGTSQLRTGDVAERTADGYFRIVGRMKRFVKLYGLRLSLDQIEESLRGQGLVAHAVGVDDRLVLLCRRAGDEELVRDAVSDAYGLPQADVHALHPTRCRCSHRARSTTGPSSGTPQVSSSSYGTATVSSRRRRASWT